VLDDFIPLLVCPCGDPYGLHHIRVDVFGRPEDGVAVVCSVTAGNVEPEVSLGMSHPGANPSMRRDGIRITFACENCDEESSLVLAQHKGTTQFYWEVWS
tara:strand:+ start:496 stop:795 length:300 start_codon:yes stop_codon:yes gene_type:complete